MRRPEAGSASTPLVSEGSHGKGARAIRAGSPMGKHAGRNSGPGSARAPFAALPPTELRLATPITVARSTGLQTQRRGTGSYRQSADLSWADEPPIGVL